MSSITEQKLLGQILIEQSQLTEDELKEALEKQNQTGDLIGETLVDLELVDKDQMLDALAHQQGLDFARPAPENVDERLIEAVPKDFLKRFYALPYQKNGGRLKVLLPFPIEHEPLVEFEHLFNAKTEPVISSEQHIASLLEHFTEPEPAGSSPDIAVDEDFVIEAEAETEEEVELSEAIEQAKQAPIIQLVNSILLQALEKRATDVHIQPEKNKLKIRFRIDGVLQPQKELSKELHGAIISRVKIMAKLDIAEHRRPQDGRFTLQHEGEPIDVRVAISPSSNGEGAVLRLLDQSATGLKLDNLGFSEEVHNQFREIIFKNHGMNLVTGPTGSGKTTTLYSALRLLNKPDVKIITIEDPIEFELEGINQIQVKPDIGLDFATGLRSILRQDPDIIMVGEIRDLETARIAIRSALTGHLVLSTLHTNNAAATVTRLLDMGIQNYLLPSALEGVLAQRLVRTLCPNCKTGRTLDAELLDSFPISPDKLETETIYRAAGCRECNNTGYRGRTAVFELLTMTDKIKKLIREQASEEKIKKAAQKTTMSSLHQSGLNKILQGVTTFEEITRVIQTT